MKITGYVSHSDCSRHDTGWRHPEHQGRLPAVARAVYRDMLTLFDPLLEIEAVPTTTADLALAHAPAYIERVRTRSAEAEAAGTVLPFYPEDVGGGVMVSGASWDAARAAAGAGITAADAILAGTVRNAFCAIRPPGSGAGRDFAGEFALFNNAAIAALHLRRRGIGAVLILELGAQPAAGTADIVAHQPGVAYRAVHQRGVAVGAGVDEVSAALLAQLDSAAGADPPEFLILSLGLDSLAGDPRGGLALEPIDFHRLTAEIRGRADALCGGRLVSLLEGGYHPARTAAAVVQHLRAMTGLPPVAAA